MKILFLLTLLLTACAPQAAALPTVMVLPSLTPTSGPPTETPTITPTLIPTDTPLPTVPTATPTAPCDLIEWWETVQPLLIEFTDTGEVASVTSRAALSPVVLELRRIQRELERLEYPDCGATVITHLRLGMENTVDGFNAFLGQSDGMADFYFDSANQYFFNVYTELDARNINMEYRLGHTDTIWGGEEGSEVRATEMENGVRALRAEFDMTSTAMRVTMLYTPTASTTPTASNTPTASDTRGPTYTPRPTNTPLMSGAFYTQVDTDAYACPRLDCEIVAHLSSGKPLTVINSVEGDEVNGSTLWRHTIWEGAEVYIPSAFLDLNHPFGRS
jgi:hypothetical protein